MIYVEVNFSVSPDDRVAAVDCLTREAPAMAALPGNQGVRVLIDPADEGAVTLLHRWDGLGDLDAYRTGPLFAQVSATLRPMMTGAPRTEVYEAAPAR